MNDFMYSPYIFLYTALCVHTYIQRKLIDFTNTIILCHINVILCLMANRGGEVLEWPCWVTFPCLFRSPLKGRAEE